MHATFVNDNHRMSGMLQFLYRMVRPFASMTTHAEVEMLRVMHVVYTMYYHERRTKLVDMVPPASMPGCTLPRDYLPPAKAPAAIHALFEDPDADISPEVMEEAMLACVEFVTAVFERRIIPVVHHVYAHAPPPETPRRCTTA